jgi:hypothetical protein
MPEAVVQESVSPAAPVIAPAVPAESGSPAQNATEQAPVEAEKPAVKTDDTTEKPGKNRDSRRIDRLYRRAAEAQAAQALLERQWNDPVALEQRMNALKPKAATPGAPRIEDFSDVETYAKAYAAHERENAIKEYKDQQQTLASQTQQKALTESWDAKTAKADAKYEDFDEVVGDLKPNTPWAMAIMQAENGEDIAYHLGSHIKEAQRIASLDPVAQIREIGRLEAKLLAEPPKPKQASSAPAPITPVSGTGSGEAATLKEGMTYEQFVKVRNRQLGRTK